MYFHSSVFKDYIVAYRRQLSSWIRTSWMGEVLGDPNESTDVQLLEPTREWFAWKPESLGGWLVKWFIVLPFLGILVTLGLIAILIKVGLWLVILLPAVMYSLLVTIRFEHPTPDCS